MIPVIEATILDKTYRITPRFRVVAAWEERFTEREFLSRISDPKRSDIAWLYWCALRYGTEADRDSDVPTLDEIGEWIMSNQVYAGDIAVRLHFAGYNPDRWDEIKKNLDTAEERRKQKQSSKQESSEPTTESQ